MGHKKRGRKPKEVAKVVEGEAKAKANVTEPDSQEANDVRHIASDDRGGSTGT